MSTRDLIRTALLVALCVAVGYLLAGIPNVELLSASVFTSGLLVGARRGALVGLLSEGIYSALNPWGVAPPPLYAAQLLGFACTGAAGGLLRGILPRLALPVQAAVAGLCGFVLTLGYDVLTNSAIWLTVRETTPWAAVLLGGLSFPFPLAHPLGNTVAFAVVAPAVCRAWGRSPA
jgi:hypothetical protein